MTYVNRKQTGPNGVLLTTANGSYPIADPSEISEILPPKFSNTLDDYYSFLAKKHAIVDQTGFEVAPDAINPKLFPFQNACVRWALRLGKAALFQECGCGKTSQEAEWARLVVEHTNGRVLMLAPLAVAYQTVEEAAKFDVEVKYCADSSQIGNSRIVITNYDRLDKFNPADFDGVVLDESSILKSFSGTIKRKIIESFARTPYKLAGTATPAPNDYLELGNHAEFLNIMPSNQMIARWFINNSMKAGNYTLKKHAEKDFWRWLTSWGVCLSKPGDLGPEYDMPSFTLPELNIHEHRVATSQATIDRVQSEGLLMPIGAPSSTELNKVKRESLAHRIECAGEIVDRIDPYSPITIWCNTNDESAALKALFPDALEVRGDTKNKEELLMAFTHGEARIIITKPSIAGFGLNWQHCAHQIHIGVSYSFEQTYQALRRSYRFGQTQPVQAHLIYAESEGDVLEILKGKQAAFQKMQTKMNASMKRHGLFRDGGRLQLASSLGNQPVQIPHWLKGA